MFIGPVVMLPWGLTLYTLIGSVILAVLAEIWWKCMKHRPEDDVAWSQGNQFVIHDEDQDAGKEK